MNRKTGMKGFFIGVGRRRLAALLLLFTLLLPFGTRGAEEFTFADDGDGLRLTACRPAGETVIVPEKVNGKTVTALGEEALNDLPEGTAVSLPASIVRMEGNPFLCCRAEVFIAEGCRFRAENGFVEDVSARAVVACLSLADEIAVPEGVKKIGERAFYGLAVRRLYVPDTVETLGEAAFAECRALEEIVLPEKLSHIPDQAFLGCVSLREIAFPQSLKTVGAWAFAKSGLRAANLPEGLTALGDMAFLRCEELRSATLPQSLTDIPAGAFDAVDEAALFTLSENSPAEEWAKENDVRYEYAGL